MDVYQTREALHEEGLVGHEIEELDGRFDDFDAGGGVGAGANHVASDYVVVRLDLAHLHSNVLARAGYLHVLPSCVEELLDGAVLAVRSRYALLTDYQSTSFDLTIQETDVFLLPLRQNRHSQRPLRISLRHRQTINQLQ